MEPKTVYEAKQGDDWDQWHRAMKDEVKALQDNETWNLVRPPTDRDVIPGKWVYKVKLGPSGQVDKYKARYVVKGFKQVEGLDYFETFAPTCKPETFRILLQLSTKHGHVMHQFDVKTSFLHSPIEEEVYLEQPQEFVKRGSDGEKLLCRLNKSIYGLKQAANNWYKELENILLRQGFTRSRNDHCLFARSEAEDHTFVLVWVDDIRVASRSMTVVSDVKKALEATFHMEDRGRLHWFLGLRIRREEGKVRVDQERYIEIMLERYQIRDVNDRKSTTGYYFKLNGRGAALSWGVKKQATVALSSSEAEYQGMAAAVQEALYLKQLLEDFGIQQKRPIAIGEDNQSCIRLCKNPVMHKRSKHIETKFHFIRDKTEDGTISIHYVPTDKMAADIFTKSLPVSKVETFRAVLMGADSTQSAQV